MIIVALVLLSVVLLVSVTAITFTFAQKHVSVQQRNNKRAQEALEEIAELSTDVYASGHARTVLNKINRKA